MHNGSRGLAAAVMLLGVGLLLMGSIGSQAMLIFGVVLIALGAALASRANRRQGWWGFGGLRPHRH